MPDFDFGLAFAAGEDLELEDVFVDSSINDSFNVEETTVLTVTDSYNETSVEETTTVIDFNDSGDVEAGGDIVTGDVTSDTLVDTGLTEDFVDGLLEDIFAEFDIAVD